MKKLLTVTNKEVELTFEQHRECLECEKPIADQEHAIRKFCEKYYDESGQVHDCKTHYHTNKNKPEREIHSNIIRDQKFFAKQISEMILKKGEEVTTEDLNAYDITLTESIKFEIKKNGTATSVFLNYTITSNPNTNHHIISTNE